jgi:ribosomal protein S18 acetylase RimI-like enzyme
VITNHPRNLPAGRQARITHHEICMKTVVQKAKNFLFETRRRFYRDRKNIIKNISIDLGIRKLFFSQTFDNNKYFIEQVLKPHEGMNAAVYIQNPQILIDQSGDRLALDPSVCYRLELSKYEPTKIRNKNIILRKIRLEDVKGVNKIYGYYGMCAIDQKTVNDNMHASVVTYFVAEKNGEMLGIVIGIDHVKLFNSPERGSSFWGLAVLPGEEGKGIGKLLIDHIIEHYQTKGANYIDLYVDYYNKRAIELYEKIGFKKIPRFYLVPKSDLHKPEIRKI